MKKIKQVFGMLTLTVCLSVDFVEAAEQQPIQSEGKQLNESTLIAQAKETNLQEPLRVLEKVKPRDQAIVKTQAKHAGFYIDDAWTDLLSDRDRDGYYSEFSVFFDVDFDYGSTWVFADLFYSYEGGPWTHYYTTRNFHINGTSNLDEFEVNSEIVDGFAQGHYEIMIEVYEVGFADPVAMLSSHEDEELDWLPLEALNEDYRDNSHGTIIIDSHGHGGAMMFLLPLLMLLPLVRVKGRTYKNID